LEEIEKKPAHPALQGILGTLESKILATREGYMKRAIAPMKKLAEKRSIMACS